jgi:hypothetical protein
MIIAFQIVLLIIIIFSFFGVVGEDEQTPVDVKGKFMAMQNASMIAYIVTLILF